MMKESRISVIIPIFNVERYLAQCLDSVIHQTYENLEIILVNDGSTDSCPQICEVYAARDERIILIHKENGGLSDARNAGLEIATGDFIAFVDSDDAVSADFLQLLFDTLNKNHVDIAECEFYKFETTLDLPASSSIDRSVEMYPTEKALELLMKEKLKQMVWNKLYRKMTIGACRFPVGKINEDEFWTYKVFGDAQKIVKVSDVLYFYRQQPSSIMGKKYSLKRLDGLQALQERIAYMRENFPRLENLAIKSYGTAAMWQYQQISNLPDIDPQKKYRERIFKSIQHYNRWSVLKELSWKEKLWYYLFIWTPIIYVKFRDMLETRAKRNNL